MYSKNMFNIFLISVYHNESMLIKIFRLRMKRTFTKREKQSSKVIVKGTPEIQSSNNTRKGVPIYLIHGVNIDLYIFKFCENAM